MKIITYNINGIRSSFSKGLVDWINNEDADIVCIQEVRAQEMIARKLLNDGTEQASFFDTDLFLEKYNIIYNCGQVAGYAGTLILSKIKPNKVILGLNGEQDEEGRCITAYYNGFAVVNCYVPNGGTRLDFKMNYFEKLSNHLNELKKEGHVIFCSDANIAHTFLDVSHPKECSSRTGFLPSEQKAFSTLLNYGFCDVARLVYGEEKLYTWFSYKSRQSEEDSGWKYRFDYILLDDKLKNNIISCKVPKLNYSDHIPVVAEINIKN